MEILYEEEDYPDAPLVNRNQTGWYWFGGIAGKHPDVSAAVEEALEKLSSKIHRLVTYAFLALVIIQCISQQLFEIKILQYV